MQECEYGYEYQQKTIITATTIFANQVDKELYQHK